MCLGLNGILPNLDGEHENSRSFDEVQLVLLFL